MKAALDDEVLTCSIVWSQFCRRHVTKVRNNVFPLRVIHILCPKLMCCCLWDTTWCSLRGEKQPLQFVNERKYVDLWNFLHDILSYLAFKIDSQGYTKWSAEMRQAGIFVSEIQHTFCTGGTVLHYSCCCIERFAPSSKNVTPEVLQDLPVDAERSLGPIF